MREVEPEQLSKHMRVRCHSLQTLALLLSLVFLSLRKQSRGPSATMYDMLQPCLLVRARQDLRQLAPHCQCAKDNEHQWNLHTAEWKLPRTTQDNGAHRWTSIKLAESSSKLINHVLG